ncbi:MAG: hypothetical protein QOF29_1330 [bacterium]
MHSPWTGIDLAADPVAWARLLRRAHEVALSGRGTPAVLRDVIVESWARCVRVGVDPDRPAPRMLDPDEAAGRLAAHPLAAVVPLVRGLVDMVSGDARHLVALSDADGMLLWAEGHPRMLEAAVAPHFLPGSLCSEVAVGTNAVGTALVLDHPVQIFSAEHFNRLLHGWTGSAAIIHDPTSGAVLGAVDLSGSFRTAHPHTLALVTAVALAAEAQIRRDRECGEAELAARYVDRLCAAGRRPSALVAADGRVLLASPRGWLGPTVGLPPRDGRSVLSGGTRAVIESLGGGARLVWGVRARERSVPRRVLSIRALGADPAEVLLGGARLALSARHAELLVVLALQPAGLSAAELARALHGAGAKPVTARAEVARIRHTVGDVVVAKPYRLAADVRADFLDVERLLRRGDLAAGVERCAGPLLPRSSAPAIVAARTRLQAALRDARRATGGSAALTRSAPRRHAAGARPKRTARQRPRARSRERPRDGSRRSV